MRSLFEIIADIFLFDKAIDLLQSKVLALLGASQTKSIGLRFVVYTLSAIIVLAMTLGIFLLLLWLLQLLLK